MRAILTFAVVALLAGCATSPSMPSAEERAKTVVASPIRTDQDRRMDESRNPLLFLPFTGVSPGMVAFDLSAGAGYTSQLMALSVGPTGKLYAQRPAPGEALTKPSRTIPNPTSSSCTGRSRIRCRPTRRSSTSSRS
jgi:predicted methyltransferase